MIDFSLFEGLSIIFGVVFVSGFLSFISFVVILIVDNSIRILRNFH